MRIFAVTSTVSRGVYPSTRYLQIRFLGQTGPHLLKPTLTGSDPERSGGARVADNCRDGRMAGACKARVGHRGIGPQARQRQRRLSMAIHDKISRKNQDFQKLGSKRAIRFRATDVVLAYGGLEAPMTSTPTGRKAVKRAKPSQGWVLRGP